VSGGSFSETRRQQPKKSSKFVLAHRVLLHGAGQAPKFTRSKFEPIPVSGCLNFEVFHHEYRSNRPENAFKEIDSPRVKTVLGLRLKKLYEDAECSFSSSFFSCSYSSSSSFSTALVRRGSRRPQAAGVSGLDSLGCLQAEAAWPTRRWGAANIPALFFRQRHDWLLSNKSPIQAEGIENTPSEFAKSNPRLGHAASRFRQGESLREDTPPAGYVLEPRPTKAVEDEDDDEYENEKGRPRKRKL
jgi:hypothetical protein